MLYVCVYVNLCVCLCMCLCMCMCICCKYESTCVFVCVHRSRNDDALVQILKSQLAIEVSMWIGDSTDAWEFYITYYIHTTYYIYIFVKRGCSRVYITLRGSRVYISSCIPPPPHTHTHTHTHAHAHAHTRTHTHTHTHNRRGGLKTAFWYISYNFEHKYDAYRHDDNHIW